MLLMKDRSFLYEQSAYLVYVKVGEINIFKGMEVMNRVERVDIN